ncbi:Bug family tripartite tricarboxylate transporter substrate binding protein [Verticiella sediminum]|nr:tripartite tricarboxylate transporter substrate binding protein [Verticiella sediminum]
MKPIKTAGMLLAQFAIAAGAAHAQPATMSIVVPYPAGGTTDVIARVLQQELGAAFDTTVIVENKPGAAGVIGARHVATAKPDGYTMLLSNNGPSVAGPLMQPSSGVDPRTSLVPVTLLTRSPMMFMVNPAVPADDVAGFIEYAKAQPKPIEYASAGQGSYGHLVTEMFARETGVDMLHIPYKGVAPTTMALVSGEVQLLVSTFSQAMQGLINEKRVKLLAAASAEPSPLMKQVPIVAATVPGFLGEAWFGIQVPKGTPPETVAKLNEVLVRAIRRPATVEAMANLGMIVEGSTPEVFGQTVAAEADKLEPLIRDLGLVEK